MTGHVTYSSRKAGFSLIELLVVIAIIVLLASIAVPVTMQVLDLSYQAKVAVYLQKVAGALTQYKSDNDGLYPGQGDDEEFLIGSGGTNAKYTGIQILTARMFGKINAFDSNPSQDDWFKDLDSHKDGYLPFKEEELDISSNPAGGNWNVLTDAAREPLPMLYFPARTDGNSNDHRAVYRYADNHHHVDATDIDSDGEDEAVRLFYGVAYKKAPSGATDKNENNLNAKMGDYFARDSRFSPAPDPLPASYPSLPGTYPDNAPADGFVAKRPGEFLLMSAGADRKYFTADDHKSWMGK